MRITSQDECIDVNYDMCSIRIIEYNSACEIVAITTGEDWLALGEFPTKTAAKQELTRIYESWQRGCSNHQIRKAGSYEL